VQKYFVSKQKNGKKLYVNLPFVAALQVALAFITLVLKIVLDCMNNSSHQNAEVQNNYILSKKSGQEYEEKRISLEYAGSTLPKGFAKDHCFWDLKNLSKSAGEMMACTNKHRRFQICLEFQALPVVDSAELSALIVKVFKSAVSDIIIHTQVVPQQSHPERATSTVICIADKRNMIAHHCAARDLLSVTVLAPCEDLAKAPLLAARVRDTLAAALPAARASAAVTFRFAAVDFQQHVVLAGSDRPNLNI
jgi:hypothetical protein